MLSEEFATFKERVGGSWAISWQAYGVSFPVATLGAFGEISKVSSSGNWFLLALVIALMTSLLLGGYLLLLDKTTFRNRATSPVPFWLLVAGSCGAGVLYSLGIAIGKALLGGDFFDGLLFQVVANSLLIVWWGTSMAAVLESRERYAMQRDRVIEDAIELEMVKVRGSNTETRLRKSLNKQISSEISEAKSVLSSALVDSATVNDEARWQPIAEQLRLIASDVMRPLSRKLWDSTALVFPKPSLGKVLRTIVSEQPLRPLLLSVVVFLLSVGTLTKTFGTFYGLLVLAATLSFIWILMPTVSVFMKLYPKLHSVLFFLCVVAFQVFDTVAWLWAGDKARVNVPIETLTINILASLILIMVTSGYGAYGNLSESDLQRFRAQISSQEMAILVRNKIVATLTQQAARNLHGKIQTRLISCAAAIERAANIGDIELLNRALIEVNEVFDSAMLANQNQLDQTLLQQLEKIRQRWNGICETTLEVNETITAMQTKEANDLAEVVEEAITNAVRHGHATRVNVILEPEANMIRAEISDNGSGYLPRDPGLGTELIRIVSQGDFDYETSPLGTKLTLTAKIGNSYI